MLFSEYLPVPAPLKLWVPLGGPADTLAVFPIPPWGGEHPTHNTDRASLTQRNSTMIDTRWQCARWATGVRVERSCGSPRMRLCPRWLGSAGVRCRFAVPRRLSRTRASGNGARPRIAGHTRHHLVLGCGICRREDPSEGSFLWYYGKNHGG